MPAERDLDRMPATLRVVRRPGEFVFVTGPADGLPAAAVHASVREDEGETLVVERRAADAAGLPYDFVAAWLALSVRSALDAVGLTAAVATRLAEHGISCNVLAGLRHDHLLVPVRRADEAVRLLGGPE